MCKVNLQYIDQITKGDKTAFRYLVDMYSMDLYHYAKGYISSKEDAEEIVSDVFCEIWENRKKLKHIENLNAWLLTLVRNKSISLLRKNKILLLPLDEIKDFAVPEIYSPDYRIISNEEMKEINNYLNILPPKCKEVFFLAKIEKIPYKEIAEMLNISVKTINIHISKALETIKKANK